MKRKSIIFLQRDEKDCAPACLKIIARYYGKDISMSFLRDICYTKRTGTTISGICDGADTLGFKSLCLKLTWDQLLSPYVPPCILHWNGKHFVVLYKIKKDVATVIDPAQGKLKYKKEDFLYYWQKNSEDKDTDMGVVILLEPLSSFFQMKELNEKQKNTFSSLAGYIKPYNKYLLLIFVGIIIGSLLNLLFPFFAQSIVDVGIANSDLKFVIIILMAQMSMTLGETINTFIRNWIMLHLTNRISIFMISDFLKKLMKLPISFFDSKLVGDILQRINDFEKVEHFLTGSLISLFMAVITLLVYSIVMVSYNISLIALFLLGSIFYISWVFLFLKRRRKLDYQRFQQSCENKSNLVQLITGMQEIKLNNCEKQKRWKWERIQVRLADIHLKSLSLIQLQQTGAVFIDNSKNVLISFLAAKLVITGNMTLGMMMALQYIIGQLNAPLSQFIGFVLSWQDAKISMERLNEIKERKEEEADENEFISEIPPCADISLHNISFRYGGTRSSKVLENINLTIKAKQTTAIVGTSGSGKTTLLKLILGFYQPVEGQILLGDLPLNNYSPSKWRANCGVVMQESYIFSDTISNNIGAMDEIPDKNKLDYAARLAVIDEYIENLPWKYNTEIGDEGIGLSTGQKQRILIARAAYKNAPYVFFDEATNSLDANNEKYIMNNLRGFFENRTVLIIAHRLSTIKNADHIVVLDKGKVVEQGRHDKLIELHGYYYGLIKNQLGSSELWI